MEIIYWSLFCYLENVDPLENDDNKAKKNIERNIWFHSRQAI